MKLFVLKNIHSGEVFPDGYRNKMEAKVVRDALNKERQGWTVSRGPDHRLGLSADHYN